jgi:hypothetical protein
MPNEMLSFFTQAAHCEYLSKFILSYVTGSEGEATKGENDGNYFVSDG